MLRQSLVRIASSQLRSSSLLRQTVRTPLVSFSNNQSLNIPAAALRTPLRTFAADAKSEVFLDVGEVTNRVLTVIQNFEKVDPKKVTAKSHFINDLGLDSLDTVELVMAFEEEFVITIPDDIAEKILTTEDAIKFISQHPQAR